ncbi:hypothetical protein SAMN05444422_104133 [Halobiforma haloterrestris]|uniref:ABC-2 type transport system permease protein n=1 Tax=Natronobacterium haloterrestre TaxID=148448 RepID=A0A1I1G6J4_NATHA|nr:hypothetical protein [Halobiforma haloterrestris]SFC07429.1 hypothetical protein SAMN05444422_104133 [Halobiforma haloterrestris]
MSGPVTAVTRTECRRTIRTVAGDRTKLLVLAGIAVVAFGPITAVALLLLPALGETIAAGEFDAETVATATDVATSGAAIGWLFLTLMAAIRTVTTVADVDEPACLLVSTRLRSVVVGVIGAELVLFSLWFLPAAIVFAAAFASGAGTVLPVVVAPVLVVVLLAGSLPVGFLVGIWFRHLITVYEPIARFRTPLLVVLAVAYFGSIATGWFDVVTAELFSLLGDGPLGWPGHLVLLAVPNVGGSSVAAAAAVVGAVGIAGVAVAAAVPSARVHWFADPARTADGTVSGSSTAGSSRLERTLSRVGSRPARTVAVTAIRRTRRAPIRLAYAAYPLFGALFFVQDVIRMGRLPAYVAVLLCLYAVWGTGVLFALNPLGDLGRALPAVLTSTLSGRDAVRGRMLAGSLVGVPLAVLVALGAGVASPLSLEVTAALLVGTSIGAIASPALAAGVGAAFPRFGSVTVTNNREAVMPSKSAFVVYTAGIVLPAGAAGLLYTEAAPLIAEVSAALLAVTPLGEAATVSPTGIETAAWVVLVAGLVAPPVAYLYAVERFDRYVLE